MYIKRKIGPEFSKALSMFPVCVLTGARQTGKSTFLRKELPRYNYITFDDPVQRTFASRDPVGFLKEAAASDGVILDEIQYVPELLQYIKMDVDMHRSAGRWILTGSQQFHLMRNISESLAGRAVLFDLAPFCSSELPGETVLDQLIWNGLYPEPALNPERREFWLRSYIQTYLERDIRQLGNVSDIHSFETLIRLCAARHGNELNIAGLSRESGVAAITAKKWIGLMESCYFLFLLEPFHRNLGKRVVKSPKIYFMDPAPAAYFTQQSSPGALLAGNMGGAFFEGFIVMEAVKCFFNHGRTPELFFWRSHDGLEVDLIIQTGGRLYPVEIKLTATPKSAFLDPLNRFRELAGREMPVHDGLLVCRTEEKISLPNGNTAIPWKQFYPWLDALLSASK